jgi:hypothetical protein
MKKKSKIPEEWSQGWLAASFMSTATTLGIMPRPIGPGDDDLIEAEVTLSISEMLSSANIQAEITAAVLVAQPPSTRWRYIGVVKTEFGPTTCMLNAKSAAGLSEQAVFWCNSFISKFKRAQALMDKLDRLALYVHTPGRNSKTKEGKND